MWYNQWDAPGVFIVYCLESVIAGLYNIIMMFITTLVKKKDVWQNGSATAIVSGYGFIAFFVVHYGFFVWLQMGIFLGISGYMNYSFGPSNVFDFFVHLLQNIPLQLQWLLLLFIVSYGLMVLKTFILTGIYKTASLGVLMFAPYARVFVQQFCVIIGGIFLQFGAGRYFILVFAVVKIFFDTILDYEKIISVSAKSAV